jgi:hypothetical protein
MMLMFSPTTASARGNPHFAGVLSAGQPSGFLVSPQAYDLSHGAVTVHFSDSVTNLTESSQTMALHFSLEHILTDGGANVADGQPGLPGISFSGPAGTTQVAMPGSQAFSATWGAGQQKTVALSYTLNTCGYFQVDVWGTTHGGDVRHHDTMASGYIRALGCAQPSSPTPTPDPAPAGKTGGVGQVQAITTPSTGSPLLTPGLLLGSALFVVGVGLLLGGHRPRRTDTEV